MLAWPEDGLQAGCLFSLKSIRKHNVNECADQQKVILHPVSSATDHKPAFLKVNHHDTREQDQDGNNGGWFDVTIDDEQYRGHHVRQFNRPRQRHTDRSEPHLIKIVFAEGPDTPVQHGGNTMGDEYDGYRRAKDKGFIYHGDVLTVR